MTLDKSRPALIVGNGPSASMVDYRRVPGDVLIFRMNMFFLEEKYLFGRSVDGFFCSVRSKVIESYLSQNIVEQVYDISNYFTPLKSEYENEVSGLRASGEVIDHWELLSRRPEIALEMMKRPLPTQGLQALASLLILGFRRIHVVGMDFYRTADIRYHFDIPEAVQMEMPQKDCRPGYETGAHNFGKDLRCWAVIKKAFPEVEIYSLSEQSFFSQLAPLSPVLSVENALSSEKDNRFQFTVDNDPGGFMSAVITFVTKAIRSLAGNRLFRNGAEWLKRQL